MKRFLSFFIVFSFFVPVLSFGAVRVSDVVEVEDGIVKETAVIADSQGQVFLEFLKGTRVLNYQEKGAFLGTIPPPQSVELPASAPQPRMQEIVTFSLSGSTEAPLVFADKIQMMTQKELYKLQKNDPEAFTRTSRIKLLVPVDAEVQKASLWEFIEEKVWDGTREQFDTKALESDRRSGRTKKRQEAEFGEENPEDGRRSAWDKLFHSQESQVEVYKPGWTKIGGRLQETTDPTKKIFVGSVKNTGIYAVFNEYPTPDPVGAVDPRLIERAEPPPYVDELYGENEAGIFDAETANLEQLDVDDIPDELAYNPAEPQDVSDFVPATDGQRETPDVSDSSDPFLPSVDEQSVPAVDDPQTLNQPASDTPPVYASYVMCSSPLTNISKLPGGAAFVRPPFLNPSRTTPLTEQEIAAIPSNCQIYYPQVVNPIESQSTPLQFQQRPTPPSQENTRSTNFEASLTNTVEAMETDTSQGNENVSANDLVEETDDQSDTPTNAFSGNDLQANAFGQTLPRTGQSEKNTPIHFPWAFVLAFVVVGVSVVLGIRKKKY